ncbi:hypothetical protein COU57_06905 [Candidatus Pacearchaeota archaeon CG10_big_fil_rev_8_21_14_0_10_32_14]|nr:MAG: hypothetical protein COU57_06905 [Candidatus Pacearchaeota archaeon CG10_big_fil_rev_8_21_14_0_10_32_14]
MTKLKRKNPKIALAQIKYFDKNKIHNLEKIKKFIGKAKKAGADIVCFPESCIHSNRNLRLDNYLIKQIRQECSLHKIWCIITENIKFDDRAFNMAILIDRQGKIRGKYKKIHLYGDRTRPGRVSKVYDTDFGKIGIAVCWDLNFPQLFKNMKDKGAEIVFCPSQWWYMEEAHKDKPKNNEMKLLESMAMTRAFENLFYVAICNPVMDEKYQVSFSAISSPHKIVKKVINKEGLIVSRVNLGEIKRLSKLYS